MGLGQTVGQLVCSGLHGIAFMVVGDVASGYGSPAVVDKSFAESCYAPLYGQILRVGSEDGGLI